MSSVLFFDIIAQIIDIVEENKDTNLLKDFSLVSHSFLQICSKYLFATVKLRDAVPKHHVASSKNGCIKLLKSRPYVVKHIRKLTYMLERSDLPSFENDDHPILTILPNILRTISRLNCLKIIGSLYDWRLLPSSLTSAFLHLMHLLTTNHIDLSYIPNFPLSCPASARYIHSVVFKPT